MDDQLYLILLNSFQKRGDYHQISRCQALYYVIKAKRYYRDNDMKRLEGQGKIGGIMFIGINPSIHSKFGNIWEDPYGQYFGSFLEEAGIDKEEVYVTNFYKSSTPENRPLNEKEIEIGWKELEKEIIYVQPKVIIGLGKQVQETLEAHHRFTQFPIYYLAHPSYIKRFPDKKEEFINDLKQIKHHGN